MRALVVLFDVREDLRFQVLQRCEVGHSEPLARKDAEPLLDLVHPRAVHGRKVKSESGMDGEPRFDRFALVTASIVQHDMDRDMDDVDLRRGRPVDVFQEIDELDGAFAGVAFSPNFSRARIESGEQIERSAADVLVLDLYGPARSRRSGVKRPAPLRGCSWVFSSTERTTSSGGSSRVYRSQISRTVWTNAASRGVLAPCQ